MPSSPRCFLIFTGINTLVGYDLVPEPKIIDAALRACRRLNDFASAVRILEVVKVSGMAAWGVTAVLALLTAQQRKSFSCLTVSGAKGNHHFLLPESIASLQARA